MKLINNMKKDMKIDMKLIRKTAIFRENENILPGPPMSHGHFNLSLGNNFSFFTIFVGIF